MNKLPLSVIKKGAILVSNQKFIIIISKEEIASPQPGLKLTYIEEVREERDIGNITSDEMLIPCISRVFDMTRPKTLSVPIIDRTTSIAIRDREYTFYKMLDLRELSASISKSILQPATCMASLVSSVISSIPIQFEITHLPDERVHCRLNSDLLFDGDFSEFISKIDPLFSHNCSYFGIGRSDTEALLNFRKNLKQHIALLNFILLKADQEWNIDCMCWNDREDESIPKPVSPTSTTANPSDD